jgi:hypothetical protein
MNNFYFSEFIVKIILFIVLFIFTFILWFLSPIIIPILIIDAFKNKELDFFKYACKDYFTLGWTIYKNSVQ